MPVPKKFWELRASAKEENAGELLLYGDIASSDPWWSDANGIITPVGFKEDLDALGDIQVLNVFINSAGGDVFAGQAIHSMLKRHSAKVNVYVDGLAASIASVIAMAGDTVYMPANAMMMVHNPYTIAIGNANEFRKLADDLDKITESLIAAYQGKSGMEADHIKKLLDAETWMTAEEAVNLGFADEIEPGKEIVAGWEGSLLAINGQKFDVSKFRNPPFMQYSKPGPIKNEGKTLSDSNRKKIQQASDLLIEISDQGTAENYEEPFKPPDIDEKNSIREGEQTDDRLLSLYQAQTTINKNRRY